MDELLKIGELAALFRVDIKTAERWCEIGKVPGAFRTPGRQWRIPRSAIEKMMPGEEQK